MKFEWKAENQELTNNNHIVLVENRYGRYDRVKVYDIEDEISDKAKLEIIDKYTNGMFTYIIEVYEKFQVDKKTLSKDKYDCVRTVSLIAWLKRNDPRKKVDASYHYGNIHFKGMETSLYWTEQHPIKYVGKVFHNILIELEDEERKYFAAHDPYCIALEEWKTLGGHQFGLHVCWGSKGYQICSDDGSDESRPFTLEELNKLIDASKKLKAYEKELADSLGIKF